MTDDEIDALVGALRDEPYDDATALCLAELCPRAAAAIEALRKERDEWKQAAGVEANQRRAALAERDQWQAAAQSAPIATGFVEGSAMFRLLDETRRERDEARARLSEGLDLCVRARKLDDLDRRLIARSMAGETTSGTVPLWAQEQYERDLAEWETRARAVLARIDAALAPKETGND